MTQLDLPVQVGAEDFGAGVGVALQHGGRGVAEGFPRPALTRTTAGRSSASHAGALDVQAAVMRAPSGPRSGPLDR